jgi:hypothetical protein
LIGSPVCDHPHIDISGFEPCQLKEGLQHCYCSLKFKPNTKTLVNKVEYIEDIMKKDIQEHIALYTPNN